jgi:hypothetical protein
MAITSVGLIALRVTSTVIGTPGATVLAALIFTTWAVSWWARVIEPRLFAPRVSTSASSRPPVALPTAPADDPHLAFARALAFVAARYLAECERPSSCAQHQDGQP